jgi:ABC-type uncharacterized transport system permease subunit
LIVIKVPNKVINEHAIFSKVQAHLAVQFLTPSTASIADFISILLKLRQPAMSQSVVRLYFNEIIPPKNYIVFLTMDVAVEWWLIVFQ